MGNSAPPKFASHYTVQLRCCDTILAELEIQRDIYDGHQIWDYTATQIRCKCKKCNKNYTYDKNKSVLLEVECYSISVTPQQKTKETPK